MVQTILVDFHAAPRDREVSRSSLIDRLCAQAPAPIHRFGLFSAVPAEAADIAAALHTANEEAFVRLRGLPLGALDGTDVVMAVGVDAASLAALYGWYDGLHVPRPELLLCFEAPPWHMAPDREKDIRAYLEGALAAWTGLHGASVHIVAAFPELAAVLRSCSGFRADADLTVADLSDGAGQSDDRLVRLFRLFRRTRSEAAQRGGPVRLLSFTPFGEWQVHHQLEAVVAARLRNEGCFTHIMGCDGIFSPCPIDRKGYDCFRCQHSHRTLFDQVGMDGSRLGNWLTREEFDVVDKWADGLDASLFPEAFYGNIPAGRLAASTLFTHYRLSSWNQANSPEIVATYRRFLAGAVLSYLAVDRAIERLAINRLFLFNGRLFPYQAAFLAARRRGIDVLVHERARVENSFEFYDNFHVIDAAVRRRQELVRWASVPLQPAEIATVDVFLEKKLAGALGSWTSYYTGTGFRTFEDDILDALDLPHDAKVIGCFTSSIDELSLMPGFAGHEGQFTLIDRVAEALEGSDCYLVVRHHPAIGGGGGVGQPCEITGLDFGYRHLSESRWANLRVIMPNDPIKSTAIYPYLDAAFSPYSSVGTELVASGVPVASTWMSEIAVTERDDDPMIVRSFDQAEIVRVLGNLIANSQEMYPDYFRRCFRSIHGYYTRVPVKFGALEIRNLFSSHLNFDDPAELVEGFDPNLDRVCRRIVQGGGFYPPPTAGDLALDRSAEDEYVAAKLKEAAKRSAERAERRRQAAPAGEDVPDLLVLDVADQDRRSPLYGRRHRCASVAPADWIGAVRALLEDGREEWVWLGSPRFLLNGVFTTRIGKMTRGLPAEVIALPLTGWFVVNDQARQERHSTASIEAGHLADLIRRAPGLGDPWSLLGLAVWRKSALRDLILPALAGHPEPRDYLRALIGALAAQALQIGEPIFYNR